MEVEILGKLTRVNCPPGQEAALNAAANELNRRLNQMTERTKVHNIEQLLIIAALNACYEVQELKDELGDTQQMAQRIEQLSQSLDKALSKK
ncbi:cell division protein ZapA [Vibrio rumoiensis]|uniref:Cell division protein ZapA n=1 Tax=Vibrio rumoiensis TaxID=76258 RepID=A0ABW7IW32_9VIBR|nr:cell division protein ZapA [Vibrio rumoiensis]